MQVYACLAVDDCFMPGDTIPPNQPDSVAFIQGKSNEDAKNQLGGTVKRVELSFS